MLTRRYVRSSPVSLEVQRVLPAWRSPFAPTPQAAWGLLGSWTPLGTRFGPARGEEDRWLLSQVLGKCPA